MNIFWKNTLLLVIPPNINIPHKSLESLTTNIVTYMNNNKSKNTDSKKQKNLSKREKEVLKYLFKGERNKLIAETDWTQLKDISLDSIREKNWKEYRQALRDLPNGSTPKLNSYGGLDMSSVTWPDKPST